MPTFYPFQWFDSCVGIIIFGLLALLFKLSQEDSRVDRDAADKHGIQPAASNLKTIPCASG